VLVVDDVHEITGFVGEYLSGRGYEIARAYDGLQAIDSALFFRPHIILLNVLMPRLCGDRAVSYLKAHPATKDARIILTSGHYQIEQIAQRVGADALLKTPYTLPDLDRAIMRMLALGPQRQTP